MRVRRGGGGFPGFDDDDNPFGGRGGGRSRGPVDNTGFYKELGVAKDASPSEIKKAYHKLSREHHPDKGGDEEKFKQIQEAFDCLKDPEKRELYDRGGKEAVEQGGGGGGGDIFSQMFGGGGRGRQQARGERKGKSVSHTLKVSLEEVYNGGVRKLRLGRVVIDKEKGVSRCPNPDCQGGMCIKMMRMGPMIQQVQQPCPQPGCQKGFVCSRRNVKEVLEVHIPRGAPDGHKLTFYEMGDEIPDGAAGDVHIVLDVQEHDEFKRKGCDLYLHRKISLVEALCGFQMEVAHLDGRKLLVSTTPGDVTKPTSYDPFADEDEEQDWECIENTACSLEPMAQAELDDVEKLKQVIAKGQLRGKGISGFQIQRGQTTFFAASQEEVREAKSMRRGCTLYVIADPSKTAGKRMMKAIPEQGLPVPSNPMLLGNLFLLLDIEFPTNLGEAAVAAIKDALPPPLNVPSVTEDDDGVEVHQMVSMVSSAAARPHACDLTAQANLRDVLVSLRTRSSHSSPPISLTTATARTTMKAKAGSGYNVRSSNLSKRRLGAGAAMVCSHKPSCPIERAFDAFGRHHSRRLCNIV